MEKLKNFYLKYLHNCIAMSVLLGFVLNFIIEALARHSFVAGLEFLAESPLVFLYNVLIIFTTMMTAVLFRRRIFIYFWWSGWWLALGIINSVILSNRMTPFTTKDLSILEDGLSIVTNYLNSKEIAMACVGFGLLIAAVVLVFIFAPKLKEKINYKKSIAIFLATLVCIFGASGLAIKCGIVDTFFGNLAYAYRDFGVPYCFINTWLNTGISKPFGYSEEKVKNVFDEGELSEDGTSQITVEDDGQEHPNIIFLQLESFIDPSHVKNIKLSEDAVPFFRSLKENYSSGYLTVPAVGAGTANSEFEVMSGMSVKFFGPGEYPYKSVLTEKTCETIAYDLKSIGYSAHAIHNHRGAFYNRNTVFANLGYDTFTCLEYMANAVKTPKNWAKDRVLVRYITDALNSTETEDLVYTISVQGHGKYPTEQVIKNPAITVEAETEELKWQWEYYVNQIHEMDEFLEDLTDELSKYDEDVVLVLYGDHIPALDIEENELESGDLYKTEYVIWSNFKMKKVDQDLYTYQLAAEVLNRLDIHTGTLIKYHQNHKDSETYLSDLKLLEYDMLYGKDYIYGGSSPFVATDLQMGIDPIRIDEIVLLGDQYYIKGENFTEYSKISLDGEILDTVYLSPGLLALNDEVDPERAADMKVSQVEKNKEILSTTE